MQKSPLKLIRCLILLLGAIILQSCAQVLNLPVVHSIPMLSNKGEVVCSGNIGVTSFNFDGAYALTNHFYLGANYDEQNYPNLKMGELNGGYYNSKFPDNTWFACQAGADYGSNNGANSYSIYDQKQYWTCRFNTKIASVFVQPAIATVGKIGEVGFGIRCEYMSFPGFYYSETGPNSSIINGWNNQFFVEPLVYCAIGYKYVKFKVQLSFGGPVTNSNNNYMAMYPFQPYYGGNISIGLQIRLFNKSYKDDANKKPKEKVIYKFQF